MDIFHHQDTDGDELIVSEGESGSAYASGLVFTTSRGRDETLTFVGLGRENLLRLYAVLGEWLYPVHTPEGPNKSLIEELIARNVREQVAAILPLHLSQGGAIRIGGPCKGHVDAGVDHDPEPGDVGHPRPAEPEPHHVSPADCMTPDCDRDHAAGPHGRLMSELPKRNPQCTDCNHGWGEHTSGVCWGATGCGCTKERPGIVREQPICPACEHSWSRHGVGAGNCNVWIPGRRQCGCEVIRPSNGPCECGHGEARHNPHCSTVDGGKVCRCAGYTAGAS